MSLVSRTPFENVSKCSMIESSVTTRAIRVDTNGVTQPIIRNNSEQPNVRMPAMIWFSLNEEKKSPIAMNAIPNNNNPK